MVSLRFSGDGGDGALLEEELGGAADADDGLLLGSLEGLDDDEKGSLGAGEEDTLGEIAEQLKAVALVDSPGLKLPTSESCSQAAEPKLQEPLPPQAVQHNVPSGITPA